MAYIPGRSGIYICACVFVGKAITVFAIFFPFVHLEMSLFPSIFCTISVFSCMESTSYVLSFRMVFFYLVTMGWIFDISLYENSIYARWGGGCNVFTTTSSVH